MDYLPMSAYGPTGAMVPRNRQLRQSLSAIAGHNEVAHARIQAQADEAAAVAQARNAVSAAAAQADAALCGILNALPIYDATDADFRSQLKQATRAGVIADLFRFNP